MLVCRILKSEGGSGELGCSISRSSQKGARVKRNKTFRPILGIISGKKLHHFEIFCPVRGNEFVPSASPLRKGLVFIQK